MFKYIYEGQNHSNVSHEYMLKLGMDADTMDSILQQKQFEEEQSIAHRSKAYQRESDPLYIEWQFELSEENPESEKFKQAWVEKVKQIRLRYPLPTETQPAA